MCITTSIYFFEVQTNIMKRNKDVRYLRDGFHSFQGASFQDFAIFSLDEFTMEAVLFASDGEGDTKEVIRLASTSS